MCVKWGTKYGPEYVNRLAAGVKRHLSVCPFRFICFTENEEGLGPLVEAKPLMVQDMAGWWNKISLFRCPHTPTTPMRPHPASQPALLKP